VAKFKIKKADLTKIYGSLKRPKGLSTQKFKDELRKDWSKE